MQARLSAFVIWAVVAAGLMFWGYRLWARPMAAPANVLTVSEGTAVRADFTRLLGAALAAVTAAPVPVVESNRFRLLGVLAPVSAPGATRPSTFGVALIAVDGKPARPYVVGARLDGDMVLQSVSRRSASIGPAEGAPGIVLELPPPAAPATGVLPRAVPDGASPRAAQQPSRPPVPQQQMAPAPPPQMQQPVEQGAEADAPESQPSPPAGVTGKTAR